MSNRDDFKEAGTDIGHAFKNFGKTFVRSADRMSDKAGLDGKEKQEEAKNATSSVFSDGSWKSVGKDLGKSFLNMGATTLNLASEGLEKAGEAIHIEQPSKEKDSNVEHFSGEIVDKPEDQQ